MRLRRLAGIAALVVSAGSLAGAGCGQDEPAPLAWYVDFTDSDARARAVMIQAQLGDGDCDAFGEVLFSTEIYLHEASMRVPLPVLPPGRYAFSARARDSACVFYAEGCRAITVPGPAEVVVPIAPSSESIGCASCDATGHCGTSEGCGACPAAEHATATCGGGVCGTLCDPGWGDCDERPENGCEASLLDSDVNCGECGMRCPSSFSLACCSGVCTLAPCSG